MTRYLTAAIALGILMVSGLVHGSWAGRWNPSMVLQEAAARVDTVPLEIGDWKGHNEDADPGAFFQAGAESFWTRAYVNPRKNTTLFVILMCGRAGRMAVHTPEVCYRGAGYEIGGTPEIWPVHSAAGTDLGALWTARFSKGTGSDLRLYWGWNAGDSWQASANPRWQYGGEPFLYKLYLSHAASGKSATLAAQDFMGQFLPELRKTLLAKLRD
jgi:hypothetical protein